METPHENFGDMTRSTGSESCPREFGEAGPAVRTAQTAYTQSQGGFRPGGPQAGPQQKTAQQLGADKIALLGNAVWLLTQTPTHKHLFIADTEWMTIPPIALDQFRLWRQGNVALAIAKHCLRAFATRCRALVARGAYLSDEAEEPMQQGVRRISPMDWKSGKNLWLMDLIAPFGGQDAAIRSFEELGVPGTPYLITGILI